MFMTPVSPTPLTVVAFVAVVLTAAIGAAFAAKHLGLEAVIRAIVRLWWWMT